MLETRSQRQPGSSGKSGAPSLAWFFVGFAQSTSSRSHPMGGCSRSSASPHVDGSLAQALCRGDPACSDPQERFSASPPTCGAFALPLELGRPARLPRLVGSTPTAHHGGFRSRFSRQQLIKEERVNTTAFSMMDSLPSELIVRAERPFLFLASSSNHLLSPYCSLACSSLRIPWADPFVGQTCSLPPKISLAKQSF